MLGEEHHWRGIAARRDGRTYGRTDGCRARSATGAASQQGTMETVVQEGAIAETNRTHLSCLTSSIGNLDPIR
jgi:hypothetical protein